MSYDLTFDCGSLPEKYQGQGGTYAPGGTMEPWLNVTYNYAVHFVSVFGMGGIRNLHGKTAKEVLGMLEVAIPMLGTDVHESYWEPTEGNARKALEDLRELAKLVPEGSVLSVT